MKSANFEAPQPPVLLVSDLKWFYAEILVIPLSWPASLGAVPVCCRLVVGT